MHFYTLSTIAISFCFLGYPAVRMRRRMLTSVVDILRRGDFFTLRTRYIDTNCGASVPTNLIHAVHAQINWKSFNSPPKDTTSHNSSSHGWTSFSFLEPNTVVFASRKTISAHTDYKQALFTPVRFSCYAVCLCISIQTWLAHSHQLCLRRKLCRFFTCWRGILG